MQRIALHWQILAAILLAALAGWLGGADAGIGSFKFLDLYTLLGALFLKALKMVVVPLIATSIICGIANAANQSNLGRLGIKVFLYVFITMLLASLLGLALVNIINPGQVDPQTASELRALAGGASLPAQMGENLNNSFVSNFLLSIVPENIFRAAVDNDLLAVIFFSLLFGFFAAKIDSPQREAVMQFMQGVLDIMLKITHLLMRFAPLGVFGLVAKVVAITGFAALKPLLAFFFTVLLALALHLFGTLWLALRVVGRINPLKHFQAMSPALLMAFSTASSNASLPINLDCLQKRAGVSERISGFVLPLGATMNMNGTALYECVSVLFIAQVYGMDLTIAQQIMVVFLALFSAIGVAGIPAASLVAIATILTALGLPLEGIGLLMVTDRLLDMLRTAVNVYDDSCGAAIIARSEGETTLIDASS
jgi:proton glutamate symport protein